MILISVGDNNKVSTISIPNYISKRMSDLPPGIIQYEGPIPEGIPIEGWYWDEDKKEIIVKPECISPNWAGLMADLTALTADQKMHLSRHYPCIIQAVLEQDEEFMCALAVGVAQSLDDKQKQNLWNILNLNYVTLPETDEPTF